jgi:hypothetical protein
VCTFFTLAVGSVDRGYQNACSDRGDTERHSHSVAGKFSTRPAELTTHYFTHQLILPANILPPQDTTHIDLSEFLLDLRKRLFHALL